MSGRLRVESGGMAAAKGGTMKRILLGLMMLIGMVGIGHAVTTDTVYLTVTPLFNLSVNISSASGTFGSAVLLRTSVTICVGTIINDGNVTSGWQKQSANSKGSGTYGWSLLTTGTPYTDQFRLLAVTTGTGVTPNFTTPGVSASDQCIEGNHQSILTVGKTFDDLAEQPYTSASNDSGKRATGETRELWASIMMPFDVTAGDEQTITLSVKAVIK